MATSTPDIPNAADAGLEQEDQIAQVLNLALMLLSSLAEQVVQLIPEEDKANRAYFSEIAHSVAMASQIQDTLTTIKVGGVTAEMLQHHAQAVSAVALPADAHPQVTMFVQQIAPVLALLDEGKKLFDPTQEEGKALDAYDNTKQKDEDKKKPRLTKSLLEHGKAVAASGTTIETIDEAIDAAKARLLPTPENLSALDNAIKEAIKKAQEERERKIEEQRAKPIEPQYRQAVTRALVDMPTLGDKAAALLTQDQAAQVAGTDLKLQDATKHIVMQLQEALPSSEDNYPITQGMLADASDEINQLLEGFDASDLHPDVNTYIRGMFLTIAALSVDPAVLSQTEEQKAATLEALKAAKADILAKPENLKKWNEVLREREIAAIVERMSAPFEEEIRKVGQLDLTMLTKRQLRKAWKVHAWTAPQALHALRTNVQIGTGFDAQSSRNAMNTLVRRFFDIMHPQFIDLKIIKEKLDLIGSTIPLSRQNALVMNVLKDLGGIAVRTLGDTPEHKAEHASEIASIHDRLRDTFTLSDENALRLDALEQYLQKREASKKRPSRRKRAA